MITNANRDTVLEQLAEMMNVAVESVDTLHQNTVYLYKKLASIEERLAKLENKDH